ncbi:anthranilate synthase component I [Brevibacillus dissolubilis]|uniref:anthranilate synthase component I n=1 Tax=Brevibacillus dissolubilis TaxID=1844116 RepID=UPI001115DFC1|nr:anthranilate synthase component I [Brevibacillus dissolubilis]
MFTPTFPEVLSLSEQYSFIPVKLTLLADQETPIRLYHKFRQDNSFLLESVEGGARWARYSFIGLRPFMTIEAKGHDITIGRRGVEETETLHGNPVNTLRELTKPFTSPQLAGFPRLTGGAVGFFGYNTLHYFEPKLPPHKKESVNVADMRFLFIDELIAFDHLKQEIQLIVNLQVEAGDTPEVLEQKYAEVCSRLLDLSEKASAPLHSSLQLRPITVSNESAPKLPVKPNMEQEEFERIVREAKEYIAAGDIFQVVLSQRFSIETQVDPFSVYRVLRTLNPSPYMYILQYEGETIVGTSPELLVRVEDQKVEVRPIAGTRKRGATPEEDAALAEDLLQDPKERAEHYMLLDLGRNDVGRVAEYGSVQVEEQMVIENYSHVMHIVSHVTGKLRKDLDAFDALLAAFPAGTVSGAPKIRAMEIIAELEPDARHTYSGAIGYISFTGNLDMCITIRTLLFKDGVAHMQAGAGIVADSVPESEYQETVNKAAGMIRALEKAEQLFLEGARV